ncbi:F0F1 ATP synthase subunit A [bacterium]|nr:MAG: F0F1 ATP synthase subunit A [bacterium]
MRLSPDELVFWQWGPVVLNATLVFTWLVMALLVVGSWLVTRRLEPGTGMRRGQNVLEATVVWIRGQIAEVAPGDADRFLPFVGTLFLFIAVSNLLAAVPFFEPPTGSLSTTAALAGCVFFAVPLYGIARRGLRGYLKQYVTPTPLMLPFQIIGELSRTLALAVRLFGNVMSGTMIVAILLALAPFLFPVPMQALGLLTGLVQAYVFAVLSLIYLASASRAREDGPGPS